MIARSLLLGRTPRLSGYACGLAVGLGCLVAGTEAARLTLFGSFSSSIGLGYALFGAAVGITLAAVVGYLNGGLLACVAAGFVPATARFGEVLASGTLGDIPETLLSVVAVGSILGGVGFALGVEKHRRDALDADLPDPPPRTAVVVAVVGSVGAGAAVLLAV
ncbi:MAG: hypothetical protein PPP58_09790 [Natronomonas sp.]